MYELPKGSELFYDGNRGIYIPKNFAEDIDRECVEGVTDEQYEILESGPEHEWYWEAWHEVLDSAVLTKRSTRERYTLYQDDDLWIVPENAVWRDPWEEGPLPDWDEQDARAVQEERLENIRNEY